MIVYFRFHLSQYRLLEGSWVLISGVISTLNKVISHSYPTFTHL